MKKPEPPKRKFVKRTNIEHSGSIRLSDILEQTESEEISPNDVVIELDQWYSSAELKIYYYQEVKNEKYKAQYAKYKKDLEKWKKEQKAKIEADIQRKQKELERLK